MPRLTARNGNPPRYLATYHTHERIHPVTWLIVAAAVAVLIAGAIVGRSGL